MNTPLYTDRWTPELNDQVVLRAIDDCDMNPDEELQMVAEKMLDNLAYLFEANPDCQQMGVFDLSAMLSSALAPNSSHWTVEERFERIARWRPTTDVIVDCQPLSAVVTSALNELLKDLADRLAVNLLTTMQGIELIESIDWDEEL